MTEFMANTRENVKTAVAGDIIGLYDTGNFQIGDTIYSGKKKVAFEKLPQFTPELFVRVSAKNVMKQKSFHKGIDQFVQEGAVQLYQSYTTNDYILGAVGQLQFEVFQFRMQNEYNSEVNMDPMGHKIARWINPEQLDKRCRHHETYWSRIAPAIRYSYLKTNLPCVGSRTNIQMFN